MSEILVVSPGERCAYAAELRASYRLRAAVFGERLGWDVAVAEGEERDAFDDCAPHCVLTMSDGACRLHSRLLPTTGPTLLAAAFSDTLGGRPVPCDAETWEWSRHCAADDVTREETVAHVAALAAHALRLGARRVVANTHAAGVRAIRRAGYPCETWGCSARYGAAVYAVTVPLPGA